MMIVEDDEDDTEITTPLMKDLLTAPVWLSILILMECL